MSTVFWEINVFGILLLSLLTRDFENGVDCNFFFFQRMKIFLVQLSIQTTEYFGYKYFFVSFIIFVREIYFSVSVFAIFVGNGETIYKSSMELIGKELRVSKHNFFFFLKHVSRQVCKKFSHIFLNADWSFKDVVWSSIKIAKCPLWRVFSLKKKI